MPHCPPPFAALDDSKKLSIKVQLSMIIINEIDAIFIQKLTELQTSFSIWRTI
jgi:hypothetical protein